MDRRRFLQLAIAAVAGTTIDPERLIWIPRTMIVVPEMPPTIAGMDLGDMVGYQLWGHIGDGPYYLLEERFIGEPRPRRLMAYHEIGRHPYAWFRLEKVPRDKELLAVQARGPLSL